MFNDFVIIRLNDFRPFENCFLRFFKDNMSKKLYEL